MMKDQLRCANFPKTDDGRTYYVGIKRGEGYYNFILIIIIIIIIIIILSRKVLRLNSNLFFFFFVILVSNRVITVEVLSMVLIIEKLLDRNPKPFILNSRKGFSTITGRYKSIPISIISIFHVSSKIKIKKIYIYIYIFVYLFN